MADLIKVRCGQGWLIVTETHIVVERLGRSWQTARATFTGLDMKWGLFGYTMIFHGAGGERLKASIVKAKDAKAIKALLTGH